MTDSLFRNAVLLMASTAIMSVLGFLFWIFVAHLYSPAMIGEASALISITTLISNVSLLGLNAGLIRFLPKSKNQSRDINAALITVGLVTIIAATVYLIVSTLFNVPISLLAEPMHKIAFVVLMSTVSLNSLTDAVFIANRRAEFHTIGYATFGVVKLILPLFLIPYGSLGIFMAYMFAVIASLVLSLFFMRRYTDYQVAAKPNWNLLKKTRRYATNNYIGVILSGLPSQLMPLFIIKELGTAQVAYFAMAWTMANLLYVIPSAAAQSLLAESSHDTSQKGKHAKHTIKLLSAVLIPGVLLTVIIAPYILKIFGEQYSSGSTTIFQLLAFSTFFVAINAVGNSILNIERRTSGIVIAQAGGLVATFVSVVLLIRYGLVGVGAAMLIGLIASNVCIFFVFQYNKRHPFVTSDTLEDQTVATQMFDTTHENIALILAAYGIHEFKFHQLHNGSSSYTFLVKEASSVKVLRIYKSNTKTDRAINEELGFMRYLITKGILIPQIVNDITNKPLTHTMVQGTSWQHILMDYEKGKHPANYSARFMSLMAQIQAHIHIYGQAYAKDRKESISSKDRRESQKTASLLYFMPKGFSHFDFDASNLLIDNDKMCVLDFEGAHYGTLITCLFFTLTRIYDTEYDKHDIESYLKTYQTIRRLTFPEKFILRLALTARYKSPTLLFIHI